MITYTEKGFGLIELLEQNGIEVINSRVTYTPLSDDDTQKLIDEYDPVPYSQKQAIQRINEQSQKYIQNIEDEYPEYEKRTWPAQKAEAQAWYLDNSAPTPTLDRIASIRGVEREILILKAYHKSKAYDQFAGDLIGTRQKIEDQILASDNYKFIDSINFNFEI